MEGDRFEDVARLVASAKSRRQVLKIVAGAALGTLVGASAASAKNASCAQWCASVFGDDTAADEQCAADAAHGTGLCYTCGPASTGGGVAPSAICCVTAPSGACANYSGATCCATGTTCQNGTCVNPCTPTTCMARGANCGSVDDGCGRTLDCGTCSAPQTCGGGGTPNVCGCTPVTTCPQGLNCGTIPDGCGGTLDCGTCTAGQTCGGGGTPNVCAGTTCTPNGGACDPTNPGACCSGLCSYNNGNPICVAIP